MRPSDNSTSGNVLVMGVYKKNDQGRELVAILVWKDFNGGLQKRNLKFEKSDPSVESVVSQQL